MDEVGVVGGLFIVVGGLCRQEGEQIIQFSCRVFPVGVSGISSAGVYQGAEWVNETVFVLAGAS